MIYVRWFPGDYLRDTTHLTLLEDGAYRRLLDLYYTTGGPLTMDRERLYRQLRVNEPEEVQAVEKVLAEYFTKRNKKWFHSRASRELRRSVEITAIRAKGGKERAKRAAQAQHKLSSSSAIPEPEPEPEPEPKSESLNPSSSQDQMVISLAAAERKTAAAAPVLFEAFGVFGAAPFGSSRFQNAWLTAYRHHLTNGGTWSIAMEETIQFCKRNHVAVPAVFFAHKREIEKIEVANAYKKTPL